MAIDKAPAYQWYPKDARSDEVFRLMTYEQRGIYQELLDHQWIEGSIPSDPKLIAKLLKITLKRFLHSWAIISCKFSEFSKNKCRVKNARLETQRRGLTNFSKIQAQKGASGARKRWHRHGRTIAGAIAGPIANDSSASASASATPKKEIHGGDSFFLDEKFIEFEAVYPAQGRGGGDKARRAFWRAIGDNGDQAGKFAVLMAAVAQQQRSEKWKKGYIPKMVNWLEEECWKQELPEPQHKVGHRPEVNINDPL